MLVGADDGLSLRGIPGVGDDRAVRISVDGIGDARRAEFFGQAGFEGLGPDGPGDRGG